MQETFSDKIRQCRDGVVKNPYQGPDKKVLFVCSMGILRSATASRIYGHKYNTRSAGTYVGHALVPLTPLLVAWADEIVFVNKENHEQFVKHTDKQMLESLNIKVLNIPDCYEHMHPKLIEAFNEQYEPSGF
jgi:predicted protein tyrosine phosphatase